MQTFLKNGYIVSMDQNDTVFDGGGVLVENDRITAVGRIDPAKISPDAEVIDLRSLVPLDWDAIRDSVSKTHRVLIVEEDVKRCGFGAELSAQITEDLFDQLDAPVRRVAALNSSVPFCAELEDDIYPNPERIAAAAAALVRE